MDIENAFLGMALVFVISVPLAVWKAFEIVQWVYKHLSLTWN